MIGTYPENTARVTPFECLKVEIHERAWPSGWVPEQIVIVPLMAAPVISATAAGTQ